MVHPRPGGVCGTCDEGPLDTAGSSPPRRGQSFHVPVFSSQERSIPTLRGLLVNPLHRHRAAGSSPAGFDDSRLDVDMAARHLPSGHVHTNNRMLAVLQQPYPCPGSRAFAAPGVALFLTTPSRRSCVTFWAQSGQSLTSWTVSSSSSW